MKSTKELFFADDVLDQGGNSRDIAEILRTEFDTKPDAQSMFLYMVLEPPTLSAKDAC